MATMNSHQIARMCGVTRGEVQDAFASGNFDNLFLGADRRQMALQDELDKKNKFLNELNTRLAEIESSLDRILSMQSFMEKSKQ